MFGMLVQDGQITIGYDPQGKRNLSSSSTSPGPVDKKSKTFVSPNRFVVLRDNYESDGTVFIPPSDQSLESVSNRCYKICTLFSTCQKHFNFHHVQK